jgi:quercetin dioxygenase-like cupin family protein
MSSHDSLERPTRLTGLVGYQTGTVVSRMLLKRQAGTVTLFAFDEGEELSEHTTPFYALLIVVEGQAEVTISGAAQKVNDGEVLLLPAAKPHGVKALSRMKMLLVMVRSA